MVQNIIDVNENLDRILNIIKAQHGFKNKSQAIEFVLKIYAESFLEPELRPEYFEKIMRLSNEKGVPFKDINELRKLTGE
ncbi:MAG: DUF2683 family protein [Nanoarchaeota archaeon]|nr:DUF2683 family protein [Nanoarchaeota archaeon]